MLKLDYVRMRNHYRTPLWYKFLSACSFYTVSSILEPSSKIYFRLAHHCHFVTTKMISSGNKDNDLTIDNSSSKCEFKYDLKLSTCEKIQPKKGYFTEEPSVHIGCSVCGAEPESDDQIVDDNWETCRGRDMFFCPHHRVQYPCHNEDCEADLCNNFHCSDENWVTDMEEWNNETEDYE